MNKDLLIAHRDPRTEIVPRRYLELAADIIEVKQDLEYWSNIAVALAPSNRIKHEELRQIEVFLPLLLVAAAYFFFDLIGTGLVLIVAMTVMFALHKSLQRDIASTGSEWIRRDNGRYAFTQFMCREFDLTPQDVTLHLVKKMCGDLKLSAVLEERERREATAGMELARASNARRRFIDERPSKTAVRDTMGTYALAAVANNTGSSDDSSLLHQFNPANGLPMLDNTFDIHGNVFGTNNFDELWQDNNDYNHSGMHGFDNTGGGEWNEEI